MFKRIILMENLKPIMGWSNSRLVTAENEVKELDGRGQWKMPRQRTEKE